MDRGIKLSIIAGILIVSCSIFYFLVVYLPQNNKEKALADEMARCTTLGTQTFQDEQKQNSAENVFFNPEYKYDPTLNACLYKSGSVGGSAKSEYIVDLFTNKEIISYTVITTNITPDDRQAIEAYQLKAAELFGSD